MTTNNEIVWKGRKTICGLPITFTKYELSSQRLYVSRGLLNKEVNELLLYRVLDIKYNVSLVNRIFGVGNVTIYAADSTDGVLKLERIRASKAVRNQISEFVEEARREAGIRGKEIYGAEDSNVAHNE